MVEGQIGDAGAEAAGADAGTEGAPEAVGLGDFQSMGCGVADAAEQDLVLGALDVLFRGALPAAHRLVLDVVDVGAAPAAAVAERGVEEARIERLKEWVTLHRLRIHPRHK